MVTDTLFSFSGIGQDFEVREQRNTAGSWENGSAELFVNKNGKMILPIELYVL